MDYREVTVTWGKLGGYFSLFVIWKTRRMTVRMTVQN